MSAAFLFPGLGFGLGARCSLIVARHPVAVRTTGGSECRMLSYQARTAPSYNVIDSLLFSPLTPIRTPSPAFCSVARAIESNAAFDLQVTCIECNATATVTARRLHSCGRHTNQVTFKGSLHSHDCPLFGIHKQGMMAQFPSLGRSFTLCNGALIAKRI